MGWQRREGAFWEDLATWLSPVVGDFSGWDSTFFTEFLPALGRSWS